MEKFFDGVQAFTEAKLTKRKAIKAAQKANRTVMSEILDWLDAIVFAVVVVLLINQFLFQLFVIPSPSMVDTLLVGDRVLVSKFTYGTEIYPAGPKIFDSRSPERDEVITFYNPDYVSKGPFFDIMSTVLYMATFSLVNIDVDENGNMREKLLVKRAGAVGGDTVTFIDGNAYIRPSGTSDYVNESTFRSEYDLNTTPHRTIESEVYSGYNAQGRLEGLSEAGVSSSYYPTHLVNAYKAKDSNAFFSDQYGYDYNIALGKLIGRPQDFEARSQAATLETGVYVPFGTVLPLGDNRDNSRDGRYFGPVNTSDINGEVISRIWPINRIGSLLK